MLKALRDKVILFPIPEEKTTKSGILLYSDRPEKSNLMKAVVLDVGPGTPNNGDMTRTPAAVKPGDIVAFNKYTAERFWVERFEYVVVHGADIWVDLTDSAEVLPEGFVAQALAKFDALSKPPVSDEPAHGA